MSEIQDRYRLIGDGFDARVKAAPDDSWDNLTPCEGWKARDVIAHVVGGHERFVPAGPGDESPTESWQRVHQAMLKLTADPEAMAQTVDGPIGPMPLEQVVGRFVCMDVLVHTWDLARAVGGDERLDQDSLAHAYEGLKPMDAMIRQPGVFGPKLDPPAGADLQTEFLYFLGRRA